MKTSQTSGAPLRRVFLFALLLAAAALRGYTQSAPVILPDTVSVTEDSFVQFSVLLNDTDPDGDLDTASLALVTGPFQGSVPTVDTVSGDVLYVPDPNYYGIDSFRYVLCDTTGLCDTAWVILTVSPVNDPPFAYNDVASVLESGTVLIPVLLNDRDSLDAPFGGLDPLSLQFISFPTRGSASLSGTGAISYTAGPGYFGTDSLRYAVADTAFPEPGGLRDTAWVYIAILQAAPTALGDTAGIPEDMPTWIAVLENDSDPQDDLDSASLTILVPPLNGSAIPEGLSPFRLQYSPAANFNGADSLQYRICDSTTLCADAWLQVEVLPFNDPPLLLDDVASTNQTEPVLIAVLDNDSDPLDGTGYLDTASLAIAVSPAHGIAVPVGAIIQYSPATDFFGLDSLAYRICDAGVPGPVYCDTAWVSLSVLPGLPVALPDMSSGLEDDDQEIAVLDNDSDPQNNLQMSSLSIVISPLNGSAVADTLSGKIGYSPVANYFGTDSLQYSICDSTGLCDSAWVDIGVLPVNDPPLAQNDTASAGEGLSVAVMVLINDSDPLDPDGGLSSATLALAIPPIFGTIIPDPLTGVLEYTAALPYTGLDSAAYRICDNAVPAPQRCDTAWLLVEVFAAAPDAVADNLTISEDNSGVVPVLLNDTDPQPDLDPATLLLLTMPASGSATTGPGSGEWTYTPNPDAYGPDSFLYRVCDLTGLCDSAWVIVDVLPVNDPPLAVDDAAITPEDTPLGIPVLVNDNDDRDPDGGLNSASLSIEAGPFHGMVVPGAGGVVTYTPAADFFGADSFRYRICDSGFPLPALCAEAWVVLDVTPLNDEPVALPDAATTPEDVSVSTLVLLNDSDIEDGSLSPALLSLSVTPLYGSAVINPVTGQITYTPGPDYYGSDSYVYRICDSEGACDTALVSLTISPLNDAPTALPDAATTAEDTPVPVAVLANDNDERDPDGGLDVTSLSIVVPALHGAAVVGVGGNVTYSPDPDFNGADSFRYRICDSGFPLPALCAEAWVVMTVSGVNDPPVIVNDTATGLEDDILTVAILANDSDTEDGAPGPGTVTLLSPPLNGNANWNPGTALLSYTPDPDFNGSDVLIYRACDASGACGSAQVYFTVQAVNDAPVALNDFRSGFEDSTLVANILGNDADPHDPAGGLDPSSVLALSGPYSGVVSFSPVSGQASYTPNLDFHGVDSLRYRVCDIGVPLPAQCAEASLFILVAARNDAPIALDDADATPENTPLNAAVLDNDSDPSDPSGGIDPGSVTITVAPLHGVAIPHPVSGLINYTPDMGYIGVDSFRYQVCDLGSPLPPLCDDALVLITISNAAPTANNDVAVTNEEMPVVIAVLANDTDPQPNLDTSSVTIISAPSKGIAVPSPSTGEVLYTPNLNANGADLFGYRVCDLDGFCDQAVVNITIQPVNDPPLIVADAASTTEDAPVTTVVIANDSDPADPMSGIDPGTLSILTPPTNGALSLDLLTGSVTYTPDPDFFGVDFYIYRVCDLGNPLPALCGSASVLVNVSSLNDAPFVLDDAAVTLEDVAVVVPVLDNDSDTEDGSLSPSGVSVSVSPMHGAAVVNTLTGTITYTPALHYNGPDVFTYQACDSEGSCGSAQVNITVNPQNDPAVLADDVAVTQEETATDIMVLSNDSDVLDPGSSLDPGSVIVVSGPASGSTSVSPLSGVITYTPDLNFYGVDGFQYRVCDTGIPLPAACAIASVSISVNPVNDAPVALDDSGVTPESTPVVIDVLSNDQDDADPDGGIDPGSLSILSAPEHGIAVVLSGMVTYTPDIGYSGSDTFLYQICDLGFPLPALCTQATVVITVSNQSPHAVDDAASVAEDGSVVIDVLDNDTDPQDNIDPGSVAVITPPAIGGTVVSSVDGRITYTPDPDLHGTDFFEYRVCDLTGFCDVARVDVVISPVNDPPLVLNDNDVTDEEVPVITTVLDNDSDPLDAPFSSMDPASIVLLTPPSNGGVVVDPFSGWITYTPDEDFFGSDSYTYRVCDDGFPTPGLCGSALVVITVQPVDDPLIAVPDTFTTDIGAVADLAVSANDIDPDGDLDPLSVLVLEEPLNGLAETLPSGLVRYTPDGGFFGTDTFRYRICDLPGNCDSAIVLIHVVAIPPLAVNDTALTLTDIPIAVAVLENDFPGNSAIDTLSLAVVTDPGQGVAAVDILNGWISYAPASGYCGVDSLQYRICDVQGLCDTATVYLNVLCLELTAEDDAVTTPFETPVLIPVLSNDSPNADPDCVLITEAPINGTAIVQSGSILYTPAAGYSGTDCFRYSVCDTTESLIASASVCVTVLPEVVLQVPGAFSPNGDGYNDFFVIPGLNSYPSAELIVFNRLESAVYRGAPYTNDWDGRWEGNGEPLPDATYFYILRLEPDNPNGEVRSGSVNIIR